MAVEWTITIEGRNEFGDVCRKTVRIDKSWERLSAATLACRSRTVDDHEGAAERGRGPRGGDVFPLSSGLPGVPQVSAGQGLHDAPDPDRLRHRGGAQSSLDDVPRLLPGHGRCLRAAEGDLPGSSDIRADGTDGAAGEHDAIPTGGGYACRIPTC